eukprot:TRINITY_DN73102_c0_g1_i1.p1 TRINITY_DN73102_c0_g1~~TRINITY_DN73102_c0_g1_i1.p1  ORF type:complete len:316 (+),score=50.96 TRINITY_DN73102_c0_g1_i1:141-1088(+)
MSFRFVLTLLWAPLAFGGDATLSPVGSRRSAFHHSRLVRSEANRDLGFSSTHAGMLADAGRHVPTPKRSFEGFAGAKAAALEPRANRRVSLGVQGKRISLTRLHAWMQQLRSKRASRDSLLEASRAGDALAAAQQPGTTQLLQPLGATAAAAPSAVPAASPAALPAAAAGAGPSAAPEGGRSPLYYLAWVVALCAVAFLGVVAFVASRSSLAQRPTEEMYIQSGFRPRGYYREQHASSLLPGKAEAGHPEGGQPSPSPYAARRSKLAHAGGDGGGHNHRQSKQAGGTSSATEAAHVNGTEPGQDGHAAEQQQDWL